MDVGGRKCQGPCGRVIPADKVHIFFTRRRRQVRLHWASHVDTRVSAGPLEYVAVCNVCIQTANDARKHETRYVIKAKEAIRSHAKRRGMDRYDFERAYDWQPECIAEDLELAGKGRCSYCRHHMLDAEHGLENITVDVYDPRLDPVYGVNTRICCKTCNTKKGSKTPEEWIEICKAFRELETTIPLLDEAEVRALVPTQMSLFGDGVMV